jgi:hypothetical protein
MRYNNPYKTFGSWEAAVRHWRSRGWLPLDDVERMQAIADAWEARFGRRYRIWGADAVLPPPARSWDITPLNDLRERGAEVAAEFHTKMHAAFRRCVPEGERLLAIGHWQLQWYEFDPHGDIDAGNHDDWAQPILPHDASHFVSGDLRFGTYGDWRGKITIFGRDLLAAFERELPQSFLRACRTLPEGAA